MFTKSLDRIQDIYYVFIKDCIGGTKLKYDPKKLFAAPSSMVSFLSNSKILKAHHVFFCIVDRTPKRENDIVL